MLLSKTELNVLCFADDGPKLEKEGSDSNLLVVARMSLNNDITSDGEIFAV